ncbi:uncharacterized protein LOC124201191 [Daphnia pulex]|uniref:uncharacterized protein LOC124201191 n=1 Tax=Daphnia pulex TaxID=6669 RepID=UPI001EDCFBF1|nr:uncharacterized protein LOC124201191 [Daphnia pulex]
MNDNLPQTILRLSQNLIHPATSDFLPDTDSRHLVGQTTTNPPADSWDRNSADTCGGTVNVPLSFDRLTPFESSQFPEERAYPLVCRWIVKVPSKNCSLARITLRVDGRSRLPDVVGCAGGFYRVYPFMKEAKICGRIGDVPPFQWYVDNHQPKDVTIIMDNTGIGDGNPEGLSFTLQGECVNDKMIGVRKENVRFSRRWINRQIEDFEAGEGPRIIIKPSHGLKHQIPVTKVPKTTSTSTAPTKQPAVFNDNNPEIEPWLISQSTESSHPSYSSDSVTYFPSSTEKTNQWPSSTTVRPPTTYFNDYQDIPWVILKSPEQTDDHYSSSSFEIYPHNNQADNVKQVPEMTTTNPWLALKSAYLRKNSTFSPLKSTSPYNQHYYSNNPNRNIINREILNTEITSLLPRTTAKYIPTTGRPMTTDLPTTEPPTTPEVTSNLIRYSTQPQTTILNHNKLNYFPTFPASNETIVATNTFTSPAPTEPSRTVKVGSPENDANISTISLKEEKSSLTKLQQTFKRTYNKLMKIMS